jgi:Mn-containing catalase
MVPKDKGFDQSLALLRDGFPFIARRRFGNVFRMRLMLSPAIAMGGAEAAKVFYDNEHFQRQGAVPLFVQNTLFGRNAIQTMDRAAHHHRKELFVAIFYADLFLPPPYPDKYDMLMDIATKELSHLEIVGATITMLLDGVNGELKDAAENEEIMSMTKGNAPKEELIHEALRFNPQFSILSGGGPLLTDSQGVPFHGSFVNANGDLTVDLRSNIAAESRAKILYEYLMKFTDDPYVKETLGFLMTREIAHFKMFQAALDTIQPNFPPGILQGDPRFINAYFNMSNGVEVRGPMEFW